MIHPSIITVKLIQLSVRDSVQALDRNQDLTLSKQQWQKHLKTTTLNRNVGKPEQDLDHRGVSGVGGQVSDTSKIHTKNGMNDSQTLTTNFLKGEDH